MTSMKTGKSKLFSQQIFIKPLYMLGSGNISSEHGSYSLLGGK